MSSNHYSKDDIKARLPYTIEDRIKLATLKLQLERQQERQQEEVRKAIEAYEERKNEEPINAFIKGSSLFGILLIFPFP